MAYLTDGVGVLMQCVWANCCKTITEEIVYFWKGLIFATNLTTNLTICKKILDGRKFKIVNWIELVQKWQNDKMSVQENNHIWLYPHIRLLCGIKSRAAISLPFNLH